MPRSTDTSLSNPAHSVRASVLPAQLPDDPAALKALLFAQQRAFEAQLAAQLAAQLETLRLEQESAFSARELEQRKAFEVREAEQKKAFEMREAELQKAFEARILEIYDNCAWHVGACSDPAANRTRVRAGSSTKLKHWSNLPRTAATPQTCRHLPPKRPATHSPKLPKNKVRGKRKPLPVELPRIELIHDVPQTERTCACGTPMVEIGQDVSEQLDIVPMQVRVLRHIRKRYGCPKGDQAPISALCPAGTAQEQRQQRPSGDAARHQVRRWAPLARFEYVLARAGVTVPRQTLARWVIGTAQALQPIANLMRDVLLGHDVIHMDETPVEVLKEPGRAATSKSQMWVQARRPAGQTGGSLQYDPSRAQAVPLRLLEGWKGHSMADGLESYGAIAFCEGVTRLGCWAHARRRFVDASKVLPAGKRGRAHEALALIGKLYAIERDARD